MSLLNDNGALNAEAMQKLNEYSDLIECECPTHLLKILANVREFNSYTQSCIVKYPEDAPTHKWLASSALNIEKLLSATIIQLARREGFVDDANELVPREKVQRTV